MSPAPAPRVSVIVPCRNRRDRIGATLDSALAQTYRSYEIIVVDDASSDGLLELVRERYPTVTVVRLDSHQGASAARNAGVAAVRGELIAFLDSDDLWSPDKLELQVRDFDAHPSAVLSFTDTVYGREGMDRVYSRTQPFEPHRLLEQLLEGGPMLTSTILVRTRDILDAGGFDPELPLAEDRDLWLRLSTRGSVRFLPLPLVRRVEYADSLARRGDFWEAAFCRVVEKFLERPEGEPYRARAKALMAYQLWKCGARNVTWGSPQLSLGYATRALRLDPWVWCRRGGRRLLFEVARVGAARLLDRAPPLRRLREVVRRAPKPVEVPDWYGELRPPPDSRP